MPHSKWITAEQYVILSKHDKIWADYLLMGRLTSEPNDTDERDISDWDCCIVGVLHNCSSLYACCKKCTKFATTFNEEYQNRNFENHGTKQFRIALGEFLQHYEAKHYVTEQDISK